MIYARKIGGMRFFKIWRFQISFCRTRVGPIGAEAQNRRDRENYLRRLENQTDWSQLLGYDLHR